MKAIILAAGRGTRLEAITRNKPKCLVRVNGRSILDRQIESLLNIDAIEQIIVLCGYCAEQIKSNIANNYRNEARLICVENNSFATTNNMYSLFLAREIIAGNDLILMNADVVFDPAIIRDLAETTVNSICVQVGAYAEESMKVVEKGDQLVSIGKTIKPESALGVSIDVYRFTSDGTEILLREVSRITEEEGNINEWTELALDRLMGKGSLDIHAFDIKNRNWYEIDNLEDLHKAELVFGLSDFDWDSVKVAFVDMDGTLFSGRQVIPGADDFFAVLSKRVPNVYLLSNNSSKSHVEYVSDLRSMGISVRLEQILLSSDVLIAFLKESGISNVFAVGTDSFLNLLSEHGINHTLNAPEAVVLAYDTELTYEKLKTASIILQNIDIPYYATHIDMVCPTERGDIPDIGAIIKLIEVTTGRIPEYSFGKPELGMVQHIYDRLGVTADESVFVGDRIYTDYAMALACKARFIGVLSGDSDRADFEECKNITIFPSVADVFLNRDVDNFSGGVLRS